MFVGNGECVLVVCVHSWLMSVHYRLVHDVCTFDGTDKWSFLTDKWTFLTDKHSLLTKKHSLFLNEHSLLTNGHSLLTNGHSLPTNKHSLPTNKHFLPTNKHSLPTNKHSLMIKWHSMIITHPHLMISTHSSITLQSLINRSNILHHVHPSSTPEPLVHSSRSCPLRSTISISSKPIHPWHTRSTTTSDASQWSKESRCSQPSIQIPKVGRNENGSSWARSEHPNTNTIVVTSLCCGRKREHVPNSDHLRIQTGTSWNESLVFRETGYSYKTTNSFLASKPVKSRSRWKRGIAGSRETTPRIALTAIASVRYDSFDSSSTGSFGPCRWHGSLDRLSVPTNGKDRSVSKSFYTCRF